MRKETALVIVGVATAKELFPTPVVWQVFVVAHCNMDQVIEGCIYLNVRLKCILSQKVDFLSFYWQLTADLEKLLKWKRHVEILLYFPYVMNRSKPTFWPLHLIYYFSVLRSYFVFLKNIVSILVAKFVVWQELSWLLKFNIICGSEVISVLFYSDFKSRKSILCCRTGFIV